MNIIFSALFLFSLAVLQASFFTHFLIAGHTLNFILIFVIIWNIIEKKEAKSGIMIAALGGFLCDVYSSAPIGLNMIVFSIIAVVIKIFLKKHVRIPFAEKL